MLLYNLVSRGNKTAKSSNISTSQQHFSCGPLSKSCRLQHKLSRIAQLQVDCANVMAECRNDLLSCSLHDLRLQTPFSDLLQPWNSIRHFHLRDSILENNTYLFSTDEIFHQILPFSILVSICVV